jgi:hypothetical protein
MSVTIPVGNNSGKPHVVLGQHALLDSRQRSSGVARHGMASRLVDCCASVQNAIDAVPITQQQWCSAAPTVTDDKKRGVC